jgi:hypothetical protein
MKLMGLGLLVSVSIALFGCRAANVTAPGTPLPAGSGAEVTPLDPSPTEVPGENAQPAAVSPASQPAGAALEVCGVEPAGLALYLTSEDFTPAQLLSGTGAVDLRLVPLETDPFLTQDDILWYEVETHSFELTPDAAARVVALPIVTRGRAFVVTVEGEPVYGGAFWTPLSSLSFDGIVISMLPNTPPEGNVFRVELGYPGSGFFTGPDQRADPRIVNALACGGILRP